MRQWNAFFARTRYMMLSERNRVLFRYRCQSSKRIVRGHPEYFTDGQSMGIAFLLIAFEALAVNFIKRMAYTLFFLWGPYRLLGVLLPETCFPYVRTVTYMFAVMNVFAGSMTNPALYHLSGKEKIFLPHMRPRPFYLNRLMAKMLTDAGMYALCLWLIRIPFTDALAVSSAAALLRPVGEVATYLLREHTAYFRRVYASFVGVMMAGAVLVAYVIPYVSRRVDKGWIFVTGLPFVEICAGISLIFLALFCFLDFGRVMPGNKSR